MSGEIDQETFNIIAADCKDVCDNSNVPLAFDHDFEGKEPVFGPDVIRFNGVGDDGHETFLIYRDGHEGGFSFCKTAQKPYDEVVCACLIVLNHHLGDKIEISSDGDNDKWDPGRDLCEKVLGYGQEFSINEDE